MFYFSDALQLASQLKSIPALPQEELERRKELAVARIKSYYSWKNMCEKYDKLFSRLTSE
jgi:glycosyltransferase involved in cell wall biosynthesis